MRAFRSEFIRIWRPAYFYGGFGAMAAFAALISVFIYTAAKSGPPVPVASGQAAGFATVAQIASAGGFLAPLTVVSRPAGVIMLSLWAIAAATDYSTGLIRVVVQAYPKRIKLLVGKIAALATFTLMAATIAYLVMIFCGRPLARLEGIDVEHWKTDFASHFFKGYLDFTVAMLVWGLIGLMLAVLTRSSAMAIGIGIGFLVSACGGEPDHHRCRQRRQVPARRHAHHARPGRHERAPLGRGRRRRRPLRGHCRCRLPDRVPDARHRLLTSNAAPPQGGDPPRHEARKLFG
jgi:ABC-2 type transport system permease protein